MSEESKNIVETVKETVVETAEKVVEAGKETVTTVTETAEKVVEAGKDVAEKTVETVEETVEDVVKAVDAPARSKKATWWNRIWSAIVGAVMAVAAMFGITTDQVAEQKAKVTEVKTMAAEALQNIKDGKIQDGIAGLQLIVEEGKTMGEQVKKDVETVKEKVKETPAENIAAEAIKGAVKEATKTEQK